MIDPTENIARFSVVLFWRRTLGILHMSMDVQPPTFRVVRRVVQGAVWVVYEAVSVQAGLPGSRVCLKVLRTRQHDGWFQRVVKTTASLQHVNIVPCYAAGATDSYLYVVLAYVEGHSLSEDRIEQSGTHTTVEVARIITDVAAALDYAHGQNVLHGNVCPRHILLDGDRRVLMIGFGEHPPPDGIVSNPLDFAPEQLVSQGSVTAQTDVFGLAQTAFWLVGGRHPYESVRPEEIRNQKTRMPPSILNVNRHLPARIDSVLQRGMSLQPEERFHSTREFAAAFTKALDLAT